MTDRNVAASIARGFRSNASGAYTQGIQKTLRRACNTGLVCDVGAFAMHHQRFVEAFVVLCVAR